MNYQERFEKLEGTKQTLKSLQDEIKTNGCGKVLNSSMGMCQAIKSCRGTMGLGNYLCPICQNMIKQIEELL